jgi:hypothetical protein
MQEEQRLRQLDGPVVGLDPNHNTAWSRRSNQEDEVAIPYSSLPSEPIFR